MAPNQKEALGQPAAIEANIKSAGLGQLVVSNDPAETLIAYGLGSCVGVIAYDPTAKVGGLLHAVLPQHRNGDPNLAKYVDTGIPLLLKEMAKLGARKANCLLYVVGGAEMLQVAGLANGFNIGSKNVQMARAVVEREGLRLKEMDVGGNSGRTVKLEMQTGRVTVRTLGRGERTL